MAFDEETFQETLAAVLQRLGKAKWIEDATLSQTASRIKFTNKGATDICMLKILFDEVGWPKNEYEVLAFIHLAKIASHARGQAE